MQKSVAAIIVLLAVVFVTVGVKAYDNKQESASLTNDSDHVVASASSGLNSVDSENSSSSNIDGAQSASSNYKDGIYTASANYFVPPGAESIKVTLSVKNGVVVDSAVENSERDPESARFQEDFASRYKSYVVGKDLNGLGLAYVAGASDTARGFNDALRQIQSQAHA